MDVLTSYCIHHPTVETVVRCSRCEQPICPKCMISTPVGMRCRSCANLRRSPVYSVGGRYLWQAAGAALLIVVAGSFIFNFIEGMLGRGIIFSALIYAGAGIGIAELLSLAANRKRGPRMQALAVVTTVLTTMSRPLLGALLTGHLGVSLITLLLTAVAAVLAFNRLR